MASLVPLSRRRRRLVSSRTRGARPSTLHMSLLIIISLGVMTMLLASCADGVGLVRCESEEDLDGNACRVDMLPDAALADMVYERGFDPEGADRMQLLDAVMQLLDYEEATGEDLRQMDYLPGDDGYASGYDENLQQAAAERNQGLAEHSAPSFADAVDAHAEESATERSAQSEKAEAEEGESLPSTTQEGNDYGELGTDECKSSLSSSSSHTEGSVEGGIGCTADDTHSSQASAEIDDASAAGAGEEEDWRGGAVERLESADGVLGYVQQLGSEVFRTMKRDLNAVVGLLPEPVSKPIREVATVACDTTARVVGPALKQAERYTRGLRRGAMKSAGKLAVQVRENVAPRAARGIAGAFAKAKRSVGNAISRVGKSSAGESTETEEENVQHEEVFM